MSETPVDLTGLVLAGGESQRFGREDKALARFDGTSLVGRVVAALREATGRPPLVAVRTSAQRERLAAVLPDDVAFVRDAPDREGPVAGLAAGVGAAETAWVFACGCDMPLLDPAAVRWVANARRQGDDAVVPQTDDRAQPLHACYRCSAVEEAVASLPPTTGVHGLLDGLATVHTADASAAPPDVSLSESVANVNTKADLAALADR